MAMSKALQKMYLKSDLSLFSLPTHTFIVGVTKMGNIVPRVGIEHTSQAFRVSVVHLSMQLLASEVTADYYNK